MKVHPRPHPKKVVSPLVWSAWCSARIDPTLCRDAFESIDAATALQMGWAPDIRLDEEAGPERERLAELSGRWFWGGLCAALHALFEAPVAPGELIAPKDYRKTLWKAWDLALSLDTFRLGEMVRFTGRASPVDMARNEEWTDEMFYLHSEFTIEMGLYCGLALALALAELSYRRMAREEERAAKRRKQARERRRQRQRADRSVMVEEVPPATVGPDSDKLSERRAAEEEELQARLKQDEQVRADLILANVLLLQATPEERPAALQLLRQAAVKAGDEQAARWAKEEPKKARKAA